ncbi:MAG: Lar family restriction alleviation protein [Methylobacillus glycogenes]|nr:Lar family restriction alleviation protein [Methylobacillus glycogenes]
MNRPSQELLPCPFCGGDAELDTMQFFIATETGKSENRAAVYCTSGCTADIGLCYSDLSDYSKEDVAHKVIDMWNTRAQAAAVPVQVEHLHELAIKAGFSPSWAGEKGMFIVNSPADLEKFAQLLLQREGERLQAKVMSALQTESAVHAHMVAGKIAKISMLNCAHTHGEEAVTKYRALTEAQQPTAPGGEVVETQWRRVNKVSGWASRWYFLDADDDIENVRKNFTSSEWEIETRDLVAIPSPAKEQG